MADLSSPSSLDTPPLSQPSRPEGRRLRTTFRPHRLRRLDGRSREARFLKRIERELVGHLGGNVSAAERLLIERLAVDLLRLELLDDEAASGGFSEHDGRVAHALRNSVLRSLRALGLKGAAPGGKPPSLADWRAHRDSAREEIGT
jgi:hypothetical protein